MTTVHIFLQEIYMYIKLVHTSVKEISTTEPGAVVMYYKTTEKAVFLLQRDEKTKVPWAVNSDVASKGVRARC